VDEIVQIMAQVADAVHAAHRQKLIHRDLKPSNILLDPVPEGGWTPYVCDFGLAMEMDEPSTTAPLWVNGTPAYMAPEQVRGERSRIGPATDVFSLGGTLHYALHGEPPQGPVADDGTESGRVVPRDLVQITRKCLEPDPRLRYPSAAGLAEDLWRFRNGEPVQARPPGPLELHWRHWRRTWKLALTAALAAAVLGAGLLAEQRHLAAADRRRAQWERFFLLEGAAMERDLSLEQTLSPHDLRPAFVRIRKRLGELEARLRLQGPEARGAGHYALGEGRFLLEDWPGARRELEQAEASGFRGPEVAGLLARALAAAAVQAEQEAQFRGVPAAAVPPARFEAAGHGPGAGDYQEALAAFLRQDYTKAAERARAASDTQPWQSGPAVLTAQSLAALGREGIRAGDSLLAEVRFDDALSVARGRLERAPCDAEARHAWMAAARGLASLRLSQQALSPDFLETLQLASDRALRLDPGNRDLQDDRLFFSILKARHMVELGQDPGPELDAADRTLAAWSREPLTAALRADRMLLRWLRAERDFRRGEDPEPALAEALRDPGHTPFLDRDYLGDILNFKARVEASRGRDPRPTLDQALAWMEPLLGTGAPRSLCGTAAQSWLIRSQWEAAHGLDPGPSQQRSRALAERALSRR
jgi:serine/threonine-protein kinase